jgi:uncharacterized membrane protein YeaQ/YmgE (transglycosylase-associated protein family)
MTLATLVLADVNLSLSNVLWWLVVGLVAGFLASRVMRGGGYGLIGDIVVGLIGAFIGGWVAGVLGIGGSSSLIVSIIIAFIGACILLYRLSWPMGSPSNWVTMSGPSGSTLSFT